MKKISLFALLLFSQLHAEEAAQKQSGTMQMIIMLAVFIVVFYFLLWRPDRKRRKALEQQRSTMKKGDRATAMGIVGTIDKIKDTTVILKMVEGAKIEVLKGAISEVQPGTTEEAEEEKKG